MLPKYFKVHEMIPFRRWGYDELSAIDSRPIWKAIGLKTSMVTTFTKAWRKPVRLSKPFLIESQENSHTCRPRNHLGTESLAERNRLIFVNSWTYRFCHSYAAMNKINCVLLGNNSACHVESNVVISSRKLESLKDSHNWLVCILINFA